MKKSFLLLLGVSLFALSGMQLLTAAHAFADEAAASKEAPAKGEEAKAEGGGDAKKKGGTDGVTGGRFAGDPIYVHLAPLILPVINDKGAEQIVTIILDVQVNDFEAGEKMHADMPRVVDALMRSLYGGLGDGALRNGHLVNVGRVKSKATAAISEVIGQNKIKDVLVQGVSQRML